VIAPRSNNSSLAIVTIETDSGGRDKKPTISRRVSRQYAWQVDFVVTGAAADGNGVRPARHIPGHIARRDGDELEARRGLGEGGSVIEVTAGVRHHTQAAGLPGVSHRLCGRDQAHHGPEGVGRVDDPHHAMADAHTVNGLLHGDTSGGSPPLHGRSPHLW
jgi:hypothetical protein